MCVPCLCPLKTDWKASHCTPVLSEGCAARFSLGSGARRSASLPDEQWTRDWKTREGEGEQQLMETKGAIAEEWYGVGVGAGEKVRTRGHDEL